MNFKIRPLFSLLSLLLLLMLLLSACGGDDEEESGNDSTESATPTAAAVVATEESSTGDNAADATEAAPAMDATEVATDTSATEAPAADTTEASSDASTLAATEAADGTTADTSATEAADTASTGGGGELSVANTPEGTFSLRISVLREQEVQGSRFARDQSNGDEAVLALIDNFSGNGATLYMPYGIQPGSYDIALFVPTHQEGRVSATVTDRTTGLYYGQEGTLVIEEVADGTISGTFTVRATDQRTGANEVVVDGAFNKVRLRNSN